MKKIYYTIFVVMTLFLLSGITVSKEKVSKHKIKGKKTNVAKHVVRPNHFGIKGNISKDDLFLENFEGSTFPPTSWMVGNPDEDITWDKSTDASSFGNGAGSAFIDFYDYSTTDEYDTLMSPSIANVQATDVLKFDVAYAMYDETSVDGLHVEISTDGGATWTSVYSKNGEELSTAPIYEDLFVPTSSEWRTESITFPTGTEGNNVLIAFISENQYGNNLYVDNIKILSASVVDMAVTSVSVRPSPVIDKVPVIVSAVLRWEGGGTPPVSVPLVFKAGSSPTTEDDGVRQITTPNWTGLPPVATVAFTTEYTPDYGNQTLYVRSFLEEDDSPSNDVASVNVFATYKFSAFPYMEYFDGASDSGWNAGSIASSIDFVRGTPAKSQITHAWSGTKCWVTKTTGNYSDDANSYVLSPVFDFSSLTSPPMLSFRNNFLTEEGYDGCAIEYSINGGTFEVLGEESDENGFNWYTNSSAIPDNSYPNVISGSNWTGTSEDLESPTNGWVNSWLKLPGFEGISNVQFRFRFVSDESTQDDGWAFDNVFIFVPHSISGLVFEDINGNGIKDVADPGIADVDVNLTGTAVRTVTTDGDGGYEFENLQNGNYAIGLTAIANSVITRPSASSHQYAVNITNSNVEDKDFGVFHLGTISGIVFNDDNGNSVFDAGEVGLSQWKVLLSGAKTDSLLTNANGEYSFNALGAGVYEVSEELVSGFVQTYPALPGTHHITITSGATLTDVNFGNGHFGTISGIVYNDGNGNGLHGDEELTVAGVKVYLYASAKSTIIDSTVSTLQGYSFTGLLSGTYFVREQVTGNWVQTSTDPEPIEITSGLTVTDINFGNYAWATLSGLVFNDFDDDGIKDPGDPGIPNWKVTLTGPKTDTLFTDANGNYTFTQVPAGIHTITEEIQDGWIQRYPPTTTWKITVGSAMNINWARFGNYKNAGISGTVFEDMNGDGVKSVGEPGLPLWKVSISSTTTDTLRTDENGNYNFTNIHSGRYTLQTEIPQPWMTTFPSAGTYSLVINSGSSYSGKDFGLFEKGGVSGVVYRDVDGNGMQDENEPAISGRKIIYANGSDKDTTMTDIEGKYVFDNCEAGTYTLTEVLPNGWVETVIPDAVAMTSGADISWIDFGSFQTGTISGLLYEDMNANGTRDEGEAGIQNQTISISGENDPIYVSTNENGLFTFTSLYPDIYTVGVTIQTGYTQSEPIDNEYTYLAVDGFGTTISSKNFGAYRNATLSGFVFLDANGNGIHDEMETGKVVGATIDVKAGESVITSVTTDTNGNWSASVMPGQYTTTIQIPTGYIKTSGMYSQAVVSGETVTNGIFSLFQLGVTSGVVYNDVNGNSRRDTNETIQAGWTVTLKNAADTTTYTSVTDTTGTYMFTGLVAGTYTIKIIAPSGYASTENAGGRALDVQSGLSQTVNFGVFNDNVSFRTFSAVPSLSLKAGKMTVRGGVLLGTPTEQTIVENIFVKAIGKLGTTFLGIPRIDSSKTYGWIVFKTAATLGKMYTGIHTGQAYPIDSLRPAGKKRTKLNKLITPTFAKYNNIAWAEGIVFKLNLIASDTGITPKGLSNLVFDTTATLAGTNVQGKTLKEISRLYDTVMTYWQLKQVKDSASYASLQKFVIDVLKRINDGFYTPLTALNDTIVPGAITSKTPYAVGLKGYKTATEFKILKRVPGKTSEPFVSNTGYQNTIPATMELSQNYPNPFNPSTTIDIAVPNELEGARVSLKIYNVLGQEISTMLQNVELGAGTHSFQFDASNLSTGLYFYRVDVNNGAFTAMKKMVLLK